MSKVNSVKSLEPCPMFPDTFFRIFERKLCKDTTWNVNIQLWKNGKIENVISDCISPKFFDVKETHLSFIKLKHRNTASISMSDALIKLYHLFKKSDYKYILFTQFDDFKMQRINVGVDLELLESRARRGKWWRIIFLNCGLKNNRVYNISSIANKENVTPNQTSSNKRKRKCPKSKEEVAKCKKAKICNIPISPRLSKFQELFEMPPSPISPIPPSPVSSSISSLS